MQQENSSPRAARNAGACAALAERLACLDADELWRSHKLERQIAAGYSVYAQLAGEALMRIGVDARCLNRPHLRGMGKYVGEVINRIGRGSIDDVTWAWVLCGDRPEWPVHVPKALDSQLKLFDAPGYRFHTWEQWWLPNAARCANVDVLHATSTTAPWWQPVPTVVTIHDTIPWRAGNYEQTGSFFWRRLLPAAYRKCAAVITISESSRRDILELWPELEPKLHVIPHGIDEAYLDVEPASLTENLKSLGIREPYLLYFGGEDPRKRLLWAMQVFETLDEPALQLVVCGVTPENQLRLLAHVKPELRGSVCFAPFVGEDEMPRLYQNAAAVLYPTLYEGFGLPALEAQAVGTPVLFSDVSSLSELKGPAAVVLPTDDLSGWVATARKLVANRRDLTPNSEARQWSRQFSWTESAARHLDVYRQAAMTRAGASKGRESQRPVHSDSRKTL